jgi:DNA-binding NarL/FixJ family response regulator
MTQPARIALVRIADAPEPTLDAAVRSIGTVVGTIVGHNVAQIAALGALAPVVVVLDLRDCEGDVSSWIAATRAARPQASLVVVGRPSSDAAAAQALAGGALAFLSRDLSIAALAAAIRETAGGRLHLTNTGRRAAQSLLGRKRKT